MKKRVFLDGVHTVIINTDEEKKTVIAEIETKEKNELIYAEKFDERCNYEKEAIKACLKYLNKTNEKRSSLKSVTKNFLNFVNFLNLLIC